jgi:ribonuclease R
MIAANVAAAQTLEEHGFACLFRVHDAPDPAKVAALSEFLAPLGYRIAKGQVLRPRVFTQILARAKERPEAQLVNEMVLRSQAQAVYSPENIGHFGLALPRYAHFTSPIRRYADLTVHRGLIRLLRLGDGGAPDGELLGLAEIGQHVSMTERRSAGAERDAVDRYVAAWLARVIGSEFPARITGVTRFGLFASLLESGADGLVPIGTLPDDFYDHDAQQHALVGRRWGRVFRLGAAVRVRVVEADPITGSTVFHLVGGEDGADVPWLAASPAARRGPRRPAPAAPPRSRQRARR